MSSLSVLRIDSSARGAESVTRRLADEVVARLSPARLVVRDLAADLPPVLDAAWTRATFVPEAARSDTDRQALALSDQLVAEVEGPTSW